MSNFCNECPVAECIVNTFEDGERDLAVNVAQGLSGAFVQAVRGTLGLTDKRINEIGQEEIKTWGSAPEAQVLKEHPELTHAVYRCEEKITVLGKCALHSSVQKG